ncbi:agmatine deiminase family protein [Methanoplanus sp. FWC-SCC4]|uniref:Agmatine deiminase family protein n=2 Tax=Methanochimaera problematica TaxID=2609417 RepID=A0AA97I4T6_9EURY|nr:agmatine deiminase family protein [Methanoplanus sp. FWC-SCC4]
MEAQIDSNSGWRFPGEFEEQDAVWVGWLSKEYLKGYYTDDVFVQIVRELYPNVAVVICVPDEAQEDHVRQVLAKNTIPMDNISFYRQQFTMLYWRDFGPIFVVNGQGDKRINDFGFNCWGYFSESDTQSRLMEKIDRDVAKYLGLESVMTRIVSEGGDREFNGKGTLLVTEACEFQRNPNLAREVFEEEFERLFGVTNVIWLKHGAVEDDPYDTTALPGPGGEGIAYRSASANNHMDEYCRFVSPDTILLAEVTEEEAKKGPVESENRRRMEENYEILKNSVDQDGKPFNIVRIPVPDMIYFEAHPDEEAYNNLMQAYNSRDGTAFPIGEPVTIVPAQSYCNFLITNDLVLGQKYYMEGMGMPESLKEKDQKAQEVLESLFPDRKVVMINTIPINFGGGGIHCSTQQEPKA